VRLPVPATALVGREGEVAAACDLLTATSDPIRLLTLVGTAGVGKTRLALAVAGAVEDHFEDGVAFVDLSALRDTRLVASAVCHALELRESGAGDAREVLLDHVRTRRLLIVLDTFEHLMGAVPFLTELLEACPRTAVIVTSRTALRVRAERRFQVEPLPEAAAMRLFVERANSVSSVFGLRPDNDSHVAAVCRRLECIPLALELAAARMDMLGPQQLLHRLERRLPLLTGGGADLPARHQSLRDALTWSYDLLSEAERTLLRRLAVFEGGWTLEAAESVCGMPSVLELLGRLVTASLVHREEDSDESSRFQMLETIREYAADELAAHHEQGDVRAAHAAWYLEMTELAAPALHGPDHSAWLHRLEREHQNLRAALDWLTERGHLDQALRLQAACQALAAKSAAARGGPVRMARGDPPPVRPRMVVRQRLIDKLQDALSHPVVLVAAPAGFGKTTALLAWASRVGSDLPIAWVSLTSTDNDPARFWRSVLTALHVQRSTLGSSAVARLESSEPIAQVVEELVRELCDLDAPLALVLDDYHQVRTAEIHAGVERLLEELPANFHLVISSRSDPPLPLARLRSNGELLELRAADLKFLESEAAALLEVAGLHLSAPQVVVLERRTEGWAAGLQLAALFLRDRDDTNGAITAFDGSRRLVVDYFVEEVLARLPERMRAFLERSSILDRLTAGLCDAVVGIRRSAAILEELERTNVFITPVDDTHIWYRYHQLFADALRHRLHRDQPEMVPDLHRRASDWSARSGLLEDAVEHALAGRCWDLAADLIGRLIVQLNGRGEHMTLARWLSSVPDEVSQRHHVLSGYRATSLLVSGELESLDTFLAGAEAALERARDRRALGRVLAIHAQLAGIREDAGLAEELGARAHGLMRPVPSGYRTLASAAIVRSHLLRGDPRRAGEVLDQAIVEKTSGLDSLAWWELANVGAYRWLLEGKLQRAAADYARVVQEVGERDVFVRQVALLGLAFVAYERNDLDRAAVHLDHVLTIRRRANVQLLELPFATLLRGRVLRALGQLSLADQAFQSAEETARELSNTRLQRLARAERAGVALVDGRLAEAARWADELDLQRLDQFAGEPEVLMLARVRRAQGRAATVVPLLERVRASAQARGRGHSVIASLVQLALAHEQEHDRVAGLAALEQAVAMADPEGFVRTFLDDGEEVLLVLRRMLKVGFSPLAVTSLVQAFGVQQDHTPVGTDLLTPRERDVLGLLAVGMSNRAIAERLVTSESTVKSHVHRIISKLGVTSRAQVVIRARELGTLAATRPGTPH
jgi:LuxR family maltose regulon positive regulatory protein